MPGTKLGQCVADIGEKNFSARLAGAGLPIAIGPFNAHVRSRVRHVCEPLYTLYADYPLVDCASVFSFHTQIDERRQLLHGFRRTVRFSVDGEVPHEDLPLAQALPVLEWGINLVIALRSHAYLMLHAAVLERGKCALLLPAAPGFGKSTLCAALCHRGWRLLSDEFGLIRPNTTDFLAVPRPIALKNESIDVIRQFAPDAVVGPAIEGTRKGTVAHVKPPSDSVVRQGQAATSRWIVFPRWEAGADLVLEPLPSADSFMMLALNAFNYELIGEAAFRTVRSILRQSESHRLVYSDLDDAVTRLTQLADSDVSG